jgi:hypothetical protein
LRCVESVAACRPGKSAGRTGASSAKRGRNIKAGLVRR